MSWIASEGGYELFFNRDELNRRAAEIPPFRVDLPDASFISPRDGDHGGTWLLANDAGLTVCLLNDYENPWRPPATTSHFSRGYVVLATAAETSLGGIRCAVEAQPLGRTLPFHLLALAPGEPPLLLHWTGSTLQPEQGDAIVPPLSSSSFRTAEVIAARRNFFRSLAARGQGLTSDQLAAYQRQHDPAAGAHSVLMQRPDASTRSVTRVVVTADRVSVAYTPVHRGEVAPTLCETSHFDLKRRALRFSGELAQSAAE